MRLYTILSLLIINTVVGSCNAQKTKEKRTAGEAMSSVSIFPTGQKLPNTNFSGNAWHYPISQADSLFTGNVGCVTFEAGARTNWHAHPGGQILLVIEGTGYYQEKGSDKRIIKKGDTVKCPPNTAHWHGASKDQGLTHIAITSTKMGSPVWLQAVTDEEYEK